MRTRNFSTARTRRSAPTGSRRSFRWALLCGAALSTLVLLTSNILWRQIPVSAARGADSPTAKAAKEVVRVRAAGRGNPITNLSDGHELSVAYTGATRNKLFLEDNLSEPTALASADFDEDGTPDLIAGYHGASGGMITLHSGNVDSIFPNSPDAKQRKATGEFTDSPFLPTAHVFDIPDSPDFLGAGDFDADGHFDVVTAAQGGEALYFLPGDGRGGFGSVKRIDLPGRVTTMVTGEINRADGLSDVVVGLIGADGPRALVFEGPEGALRAKPEVIPLPAEATAMAVGRLSDGYEMGLAVAAGNELVIVHGRDRKQSLDETQQAGVPPPLIEQHSFPFLIRSIELGHFISDQANVADIALLADDGTIHFAAKAKKAEAANKDSSKQEAQDRWEVRDLASESWPMATRLTRVKVSSLPMDDLMVVDSLNSQLHIVSQGSVISSDGSNQPAKAPNTQSTTDNQVTTLDVDSAPTAVLAMRLNSDALSDLVILRQGKASPVVVMTAPAHTFTVNSAGNEPDADLTDDICSDCERGANGVCKRDSNNKIILNNVCSLDAAVQQSNASKGANAIIFNIPGAGVHTIIPNGNSAIFGLSVADFDPVTVDGTTQPGFAGSPLIEVRFKQLSILRGPSTVMGLAINGADKYGIYIDARNGATGSGSQVQGNFIGLDPNGTTARQNGIGVFIDNASNTAIGGTTTAARNVISANGGAGIDLVSDTATGTLIQGNFIGTNAAGTAAIGNANGILVESTITTGLVGNMTIGGTAAGARNLISGNSNNGISTALDSKTVAIVQGNYIGTDTTGTVGLGNGFLGIGMSTNNNTIGGTGAGARNIVSSNAGSGVQLGGTGNNVQGNFIGTNANGTAALGNSKSGVTVFHNASNTIGGVTAFAGNVISGNKANGVEILGFGNNNTVQSNLIGVASDGNTPLANALAGVFIQNADNSLIGGASSFAANIIANNGGAGVRVLNGVFDNINHGINNNIQRNSIYKNGALGIDLGPQGVTLNDADCSRDGANHLRNFPILGSPEITADGKTKFDVSLQCQPNTTYRIDFYSNATGDPSNHGQGQTFLFDRTVTTDNQGGAAFAFVSDGPLPAGTLISATATDPDGNTSEFSCLDGRCGADVPFPAQLEITKTVSPSQVTVGQNLTYTITVKNKGPNTAQAVTLTDPLASNLTFSTANSTQGNPSQSNGVVTCNIGTLANAATATVTIVATVNAAGDIPNTATASGANSQSVQASVHATASAACTFTLASPSVSVPASGGTRSVSFTASASNCAWVAMSNASWISITSAASGTGNGTVNYAVAANTGSDRTGALTIAGQIFTVNQAAPSPTPTPTPTPTPVGYTPTGSNVTVQGNGGDATFSQVGTAGITTFTPISPASAGSLPGGYVINGSSVAFDVSTTAGYTPPVDICFNMSSVNDATAFSALAVLHNEGGTLFDRTISRDFAGRRICGRVNSLSPFVVATRITIQFSSSSYSVTKGDPNNPRVNIGVTRTGDTTSSASVGYSTIDDAGLQNCNVFNGIASPRCDYEFTVGTLQFAAGETSKSFSVAIIADSYAKGTLTFRVTLSNPSGVTLAAPSTANVTIFDNPSVDGPNNPIDNTDFFVRQQYLDFLGREPDPAGPVWISIINGCAPNDTSCDRIHVSQNFFQSEEFQTRGYFIYRFYPVSFPNVSGSDPAGYGHKPDYMQFVPDLARVSGFLDANQLEAAKVAFIADFMARPAFANTYNGLTNTQYVDMLLSNANAGIGASTRQGWIEGLNNSTLTRAVVLRQIAESTEVYNKYYNPAFAIMEYFGYLRRDPDGAYLVWIQVLNQSNDPRGMITGFVNSNEYRARFGP